VLLQNIDIEMLEVLGIKTFVEMNTTQAISLDHHHRCSLRNLGH
jgi:hypothetical protein